MAGFMFPLLLLYLMLSRNLKQHYPFNDLHHVRLYVRFHVHFQFVAQGRSVGKGLHQRNGSAPRPKPLANRSTGSMEDPPATAARGIFQASVSSRAGQEFARLPNGPSLPPRSQESNLAISWQQCHCSIVTPT